MRQKQVAKLYNEWLKEARKTKDYDSDKVIKEFLRGIPKSQLEEFCEKNWLVYSKDINEVAQEMLKSFKLWASIEFYELELKKRKKKGDK